MKYDYYVRTETARQHGVVAAQQVLFRRVLHRIPFRSALEIGPGFGGFAEYCKARDVRYWGLEENASLAAVLQARGHQILVGDVRGVHLPAGRFDLVFMSHVIEHLNSYQEVCTLLSRIALRVSTPGHVVLLFPDVDWSPRRFHADYSHTFPTTLCAIERLCSDLGVCVVRSGHYVGRWLLPWKLLWFAHRMLPTWLLPERMAVRIDTQFAAHAFALTGEDPTASPAGSAFNSPNPQRQRATACRLRKRNRGRPRRLLTVLPVSSTMAEGLVDGLVATARHAGGGADVHNVRHSSELGLMLRFSRRGTSDNRR